MRILHIINVRWYNATAWYAFALAKSALQAGDSAAIAGLPGSPVILKAKDACIETLEAPFTSNNPFVIFKNIRLLSRFIDEFMPEAVVCHRGEMFFAVAFYKFLFRKPWKLIRVRGDVRPPSSDVISRFTHNVCCDKIVVPNKFMKKEYINRLKTPEENISVIYGGVDVSFFKKDSEERKRIRKEFGFKDDDYVVCVVGRFDPVKGHKIFLEACGILRRKGMQNLKIFLAGFPENISDAQIKEIAAKNGVMDITFITGKRNDINALINACDLGVISSVGSEAICRVAMEFMACGVKIVTSDAGVLPEITPYENSYPMLDAQALARRIESHCGYLKIYDEKDFYRDFKAALL